MTFFKKYSGSTDVRMVRMERLIWTLIYGGLIAVVLGYFLETSQEQNGSELLAGGGMAVAAGVILIWVRSRMHE
jgi:vacuolar-type H+-ATPase subunit I/STV1